MGLPQNPDNYNIDSFTSNNMKKDLSNYPKLSLNGIVTKIMSLFIREKLVPSTMV
ncbi:14957_t:CDS:2 [Rhizophagus irregularis]|nr:14957_t:CDS:2 [Rhizophagus irregularis]